MSGLGLAAQRAAVENYIRTYGGTIEEDFIEVESGKKNKRPELEQAIEYCRRHKTILLIAKLDRLSRNLHFITGLMEAKIEFKAADNPNANDLMIHMLAAFAEHERKMISERTSNALKAAKKRGVKLGTYGKVLAEQNKDKANEFARLLMPVVQSIRSEGIQTVRGICEELNKRGITTSKGNSFYIRTTHQLLNRIDTLQA